MIPFSFEHILNEWNDFLPKEGQVQSYEELGWYVSPIMIPEDITNDAVIGAEQFYQGQTDFQFGEESRIADDKHNIDFTIRNNEFVTLRKKQIQTLGFHPLITGTAALLAKTKEIRLFADSLILKSPEKPRNKGVVGWHSDKAYWPTCTSDNMLTAWIPLQDCTIDMGPLVYINKSHLWREDASLKTFFSFNNQNLEHFEKHLTKHKSNYVKESMIVKKGQVCFHNCHTIHCSFPNISKTPRLALSMHFQNADNAYQKSYKENGDLISIGYDTLCRKDNEGNPDYSDEKIFPLLFTNQRI